MKRRAMICRWRAWWVFSSLSMIILFLPACDAGAPKTPQLEVVATSYDFGTVKQGERVEHGFVIKNRGKAKLRIKGVDCPRGLFLEAKADEEIPPGGSGQVVLSLETFKYTETIQIKAVVYTNDPNLSSFELALTGRVIAPIAFRPFKAVFLAAFQGETVERVLTINNNTETPLEIFGIEAGSKRFQAQLQKVKEGQEYKLIVNNNPDATPGKTREDLLLFVSHPEPAEIKLPVNIYIKKDVYLFPDAVTLGKIGIGELQKKLAKSPEIIQLLTQTVLVKLRPGKGKNFQIKLEHELPFLNIKKTPESNSETYRLDVSLVPDKLKPGKIDSYITVHTNDKEVPELSIPVKGEFL
jgi:hypothetical protein